MGERKKEREREREREREKVEWNAGMIRVTMTIQM